jgi:hypothetical protein
MSVITDSKLIKQALTKIDNCIATTAQTLTTATGIVLPTGKSWSDVSYVIFQVDNQTSPVTTTDCVRYCEDGTTPSATVGKFLSHGESSDIIGANNASKLKLIRIGADTVVLQIAFYK